MEIRERIDNARIPEAVSDVLARLEAAGFEAYLVGGCVRDWLMGNTPKDYDVTTNALVEQTQEVFRDFRVVETGIKHGTVTVISEGIPIEVTTYRVDGSYVADIVGEHGVIEIQTRGVAHLKPKLSELLEAAPVTVVHPVILRKRIVNLDGDTGEVTSVRFSPKRGSLYTAMRELYALKPLLPQQRLTVRLPLLEADEIRSFGVRTRRRKKQRTRQGEYVSDLLPTDIVDEIILAQPSDYEIFLPGHLSGSFGAAELAEAAATDLPAARRVLNLLTFLGLTEAIGKDGRRTVYRRVK